MKRGLLAAAVVIAGTVGYLAFSRDSGDTENSILPPGSQAVVAGSGVGGETAYLDQGKDPVGGGATYLEPGVRVTIGSDDGTWAETNDEMQERADSVMMSDPKRAGEIRSTGPANVKYPNPRASMRRVRVTVESGEHRDESGKIARYRLRPIR